MREQVLRLFDLSLEAGSMKELIQIIKQNIEAGTRMDGTINWRGVAQKIWWIENGTYLRLYDYNNDGDNKVLEFGHAAEEDTFTLAREIRRDGVPPHYSLWMMSEELIGRRRSLLSEYLDRVPITDKEEALRCFSVCKLPSLYLILPPHLRSDPEIQKETRNLLARELCAGSKDIDEDIGLDLYFEDFEARCRALDLTLNGVDTWEGVEREAIYALASVSEDSREFMRGYIRWYEGMEANVAAFDQTDAADRERWFELGWSMRKSLQILHKVTERVNQSWTDYYESSKVLKPLELEKHPDVYPEKGYGFLEQYEDKVRGMLSIRADTETIYSHLHTLAEYDRRRHPTLQWYFDCQESVSDVQKSFDYLRTRLATCRPVCEACRTALELCPDSEPKRSPPRMPGR